MAFRNVPRLSYSPTHEQLFSSLKRKVIGEYVPDSILPVIDLYRFKPSDLPIYIERSLRGNLDQYKWYFFCPRSSTNRRIVPGVGYWKIIGKSKVIVSVATGEVLGKKSILSFVRSAGSSENGRWAVHEYTLDSSYLGYNIDQMPLVAYCLKRRRN